MRAGPGAGDARESDPRSVLHFPSHACECFPGLKRKDSTAPPHSTPPRCARLWPVLFCPRPTLARVLWSVPMLASSTLASSTSASLTLAMSHFGADPEAVRTHVPSISRAYSPTARSIVFVREVQQGDPSGPVLFVMAIHTVLLGAPSHGDWTRVFYLDDGLSSPGRQLRSGSSPKF